jgi:hypothetical protein
MSGGRHGAMVTLLAAACAMAVARPVSAQQPGRPPARQVTHADTAQQRTDTTTQQVDSTKLEMQRRLERLGRPMGSDTLFYLRDSVSAAQRRTRSTAPQAPRNDTTLRQLMRMPGYGVTEYQGGQADFAAKKRILILESSKDHQARVQRDGNDIQADSTIRYNQITGLIRATGTPDFTPAGQDKVSAQGLVYSLKEGRGSAPGAKTTYDQAGTKWVTSGDMVLLTRDSTYSSHAIFTSCTLPLPHYHFETDEIKIIGGKVLVARPVRLYFADVPVAWLPFIANSLSKGRASGILTPQFSVNDIVRTSAGYHRRVSNLGFYWAMSQYSDAIIAFDWWSQNYLSMTSGLNYRFNRQFLNGSVDLRRFWQSDGGRQLTLNTQNSWQVDERTSVRMSAQYASSASFVTQNSLDPQEVTQSINSSGGINHRFDWGNLSVSANRQQYLNDGRVAWTLPSANLSLSTITLFKAPTNEAHFWNNMTMSGSAALTRSTLNRVQPDTFTVGSADTQQLQGSESGSLSMGAFSLRQSVNFQRSTAVGIPKAYLLLGDSADPSQLVAGSPSQNVSNQTVGWSASMDYQQRLIGSTTLTPSLTLSGDLFQSDTSSLAHSFVSAPSRVSFGASLKTDVYRFFPGFGPYSAIRHKVSPSFRFAWSPGTKPTALQSQVFRGTQAIGPTKTLSLTLNQTFEAKKKQTSDSTSAADSTRATADTTGSGMASGVEGGSESGAPREVQKPQIVQLLGISTSVVSYDFVRADTTNFIDGFTTTQLHNQITSDFLKGLTLSINHDLFEDTYDANGRLHRKFSPHLSQVNFNFSLGANSGIIRFLHLGGRSGSNAQADTSANARQGQAADTTAGNSFATSVTDANSIIPGRPNSESYDMGGTRRGGGGQGWQANLSYALQRPRSNRAAASQMISGTVTLHPTEYWNVSWRTSYDLERGKFNDQAISLTRDLHRWEAHFIFTQPATGNWQFSFEVSLTDERDLKFNYAQRSAGAGGTSLPSVRPGQ